MLCKTASHAGYLLCVNGEASMTVEQARNELGYCKYVSLYLPETAIAMLDEVRARLGSQQQPLAGLGVETWKQIRALSTCLYMTEDGKAEIVDWYGRHWTIPVEYIREAWDIFI